MLTAGATVLATYCFKSSIQYPSQHPAMFERAYRLEVKSRVIQRIVIFSSTNLIRWLADEQLDL